MRTYLIAAAALLLALSAAGRSSAQFPYGGGFGGVYGGYGYGGAGFGYGGFGGYGYRGIGGSLSPYLNLVNRGVGNRATNYFNFVRPGVMNPANMAPFVGVGPTYMNRPPLFPQMPTEDEDRRRAIRDLSERSEQAKQQGLPPTGHPTFFNETFGFFGPQSSTPGMGFGGRGSPAARLGRPR